MNGAGLEIRRRFDVERVQPQDAVVLFEQPPICSASRRSRELWEMKTFIFTIVDATIR